MLSLAQDFLTTLYVEQLDLTEVNWPEMTRRLVGRWGTESVLLSFRHMASPYELAFGRPLVGTKQGLCPRAWLHSIGSSVHFHNQHVEPHTPQNSGLVYWTPGLPHSNPCTHVNHELSQRKAELQAALCFHLRGMLLFVKNYARRPLAALVR